jgi:hypothetical protein
MLYLPGYAVEHEWAQWVHIIPVPVAPKGKGTIVAP